MTKLLSTPQVLVGPNSVVPLTCRIVSSILHSSNFNDSSIIREGLVVLSKALPKFSLVIVQVYSFLFSIILYFILFHIDCKYYRGV